MSDSHCRLIGGFGTTETYKRLNKLGEGTYATVYKGYVLHCHDVHEFVCLRL